MIRSHLVLGMACLAFAACDAKMSGTLQVSDSLQVEAANGLFRKTTVIRPGTYSTTAETGPATTLFTLSGNGQKIQFRTKSLISLRDKLQQADHARLSAAELTQPFDIDLTVSTTVLADGDVISKVQQCVLGSHQEPYQFCYPDTQVCAQWRDRWVQKPGTNGDERSDFNLIHECAYYQFVPGACEMRFREVTDYGSQIISGYNHTTQRGAAIQIIQGGQVVATMNDAAEPAQTNFVTTNIGDCRR